MLRRGLRFFQEKHICKEMYCCVSDVVVNVATGCGVRTNVLIEGRPHSCWHEEVCVGKSLDVGEEFKKPHALGAIAATSLDVQHAATHAEEHLINYGWKHSNKLIKTLSSEGGVIASGVRKDNQIQDSFVAQAHLAFKSSHNREIGEGQGKDYRR